ncbi:histidine phosphatase family protein [Metabacillus litoralis]|uniref:histidine phosphatase family protein n=1 Tax=Metabacillus litoralis TaxID=152268 RepID=UPI00299E59CC|nr:histidine phosphatase family protein [Metabacillus litoralis]
MRTILFFSNTNIDRIISSPYKRAIDSITPLATRFNIDVEINRKLSERILSTKNIPDWFEKLRSTFDDIDLKFEGGESSREAMNRVVEVVEEAYSKANNNTVIVTHGNLMSLLLMYFNKDFRFEQWRRLSNPDVFLLKNEANQVTFQRVWE